MGENATEGIYIGVYIFIFVVALSATITMFFMINNYAELSYEYGKKIENSGTLIEGAPTTTYRIVNGDQLIAYYYNYIRNSSNIYHIEVKNLKGDNILELNKMYNYNEVLNLISPSKEYVLNYNKVTTKENGSKEVYITISEINQQ